jgi:hypothetical protein
MDISNLDRVDLFEPLAVNFTSQLVLQFLLQMFLQSVTLGIIWILLLVLMHKVKVLLVSNLSINSVVSSCYSSDIPFYFLDLSGLSKVEEDDQEKQTGEDCNA